MLRAGQVVQLVAIALLGLAVVMVTSAGMTVGRLGTEDSIFASMWSKHAAYAIVAVAVMVLASRIKVGKLSEWRGWTNPVFYLMAGAMILSVAAMIPGIGIEINHSRRWLKLGPVQFQPSELIKWAMVITLALWCARRQKTMRSFKQGLLPPLVLLALACGLVVKEDLGTAALVGVVAVIMLYAAGARWWHIAALVPPGVTAVVLAIAHSPYRRARLTSFLDPWADAQRTGYQAIQSMLAISQGGVTGRGLGNGIQKFGYLPTDTSDCLFAIICEELGLPGALLVVGLYLALIWFGLRIVRDCRDAFTRMLALGVIMTVGIQALINIAVVTVVVPTKGIALPLLSAGGTGWIMTAFMLGLLAAIDRHNAAVAAISPLHLASEEPTMPARAIAA